MNYDLLEFNEGGFLICLKEIMLNILINAYACAPHKGSEPGMAWNWIINLARHCRLFVITEGEWQREIELALDRLPEKENITFYYNPVSPKIRQMCWNQGDWRFYYFYRQWQKKTFGIARDIIENHPIDLVHQLNMVGYREPGLLWKFRDIPSVWGPIGGFGGVPNSFLELYGWKDKIKQLVKGLLNQVQVYSPYIQNAIINTSVLIACNSVAKDVLSRFRGDGVGLVSEVGTFSESLHTNEARWAEEQLQLCWIGRNYPTKALIIALRVFKQLEGFPVHLRVIGVDVESVPPREMANLKNVTFHAWLPLDEVHKQLGNSHALLFTSLYEATGTAVLEALSNGVPVLCHDTCGQGDVIDDSCGIKIPLKNPESSVRLFKKAIIELLGDRKKLRELAFGALKRAEELTWEEKVKQMIAIYSKALTAKKSPEKHVTHFENK